MLLSFVFCIGVVIDLLDWDLYGFYVYYVIVKVMNRVMLFK